jgi:anaerobic ribonucleoside-triphosphate reductase activating protein
MENDIVDGEGVCVSFWTQGCPHRCKGCHNPETWSFEDGIEENDFDLLLKIINLINKNNVNRNLSILGGEPLCSQNKDFVLRLVKTAKAHFPNIKIFLWTGYLIEELQEKNSEILEYVDVLIDGPFILEKRDLSLYLRGSSNQRVLYKNKDY